MSETFCCIRAFYLLVLSSFFAGSQYQIKLELVGLGDFCECIGLCMHAAGCGQIWLVALVQGNCFGVSFTSPQKILTNGQLTGSKRCSHDTNCFVSRAMNHPFLRQQLRLAMRVLSSNRLECRMR